MKNRIEQELERKEFEKEIERHLKLESETLESQEKLLEGKNKYAVAAIHFLGTLGICYVAYMILYFAYTIFFGTAFSMLGINFSWITPIIHGTIWIAAVVSVYHKRSVLDEILDRFG